MLRVANIKHANAPYTDVGSTSFDLHRHNPNATKEQVHQHVKRKYDFDECSVTNWFLMYHTYQPRRVYQFGFEVIEAIAVNRPFPCNKKHPKLLEPGLQVFLHRMNIGVCVSLFVKASCLYIMLEHIVLLTETTILKLLVKKGHDGYHNKQTYAIICVPRAAIHECDVDEDELVSDETSWFRTVNVNDIDCARTFGEGSYAGFLNEVDFSTAKGMYAALLNKFAADGTVPAWFLRGINPHYLLTIDPNCIVSDGHSETALAKGADTDYDEAPGKRKRKKTQTYDPHIAIEEEKAKRGRSSLGSSKVNPGKKSKKPRKEYPDIYDEGQPGSTGEDYNDPSFAAEQHLPDVTFIRESGADVPQGNLEKVFVRLDKLDIQMSNISQQLILMQQNQVRFQDIKPMLEDAIAQKMPKLLDTTTIQTTQAIDRSISNQLKQIYELCEKTVVDTSPLKHLLENMAKTIGDLAKKIDEQGTKFTVQEFEAFAERERSNLKLVVEYAQAMNARFAAPPTPAPAHPYQALLDYPHQGVASWAPEHQASYRERLLPHQAPMPPVDLVQRYEEQSRHAKSILAHRSPNKSDSRPTKEAESVPSDQAQYSQFLEWQREQRDKDRT